MLGEIKIVAVMLCLLVPATAFAEDARPLSESAEIQWGEFIGNIKEANKVVVYLGTPRRRDSDPKSTEPTIEIEDFEFYREPRELTPEIAAKLTSLVLDPHSFYDYRGMRFCGGFHPDICIEWRFEQNGQYWHQRAFACLGCREWRLIDTMTALHTDMAKDAADELVRVLRELRDPKKK